MRLIKREVVLNEKDSSPEFEVTLRVPVDSLADDIARNENVYAEVGEKFIDTVTGEPEGEYPK
jgi:hypothetical protein